MAKSIQLTEAEEKEIIAKREREAAEKKEAEAKEKLEIARKVELMHESIRNFKEERRLLDNETACFVGQFLEKAGANLYRQVRTPAKRKFEADNGRWSDNKVVYASEEVEYEERKIEYVPNPAYYITVKEHTVSRRHSMRSANRGYKMFLNVKYSPELDSDDELQKATNKAYSNARKIHDHITGHVERAKARAERKTKKANAIEQAITTLTEKYPDATITKDTASSSYPINYRRRSYRYWEVVKVVHPNGVQFQYEASLNDDGELELKRSLKSYGNIDQENLWDHLITLPKKENAA